MQTHTAGLRTLTARKPSNVCNTSCAYYALPSALLLSSFLSPRSVFADVTAQNELTTNVLSQCETRQQFNDLLTELFDYPRYSCPRRHGNRYMTTTPHMGPQLDFLMLSTYLYHSSNMCTLT